MAYCTKCGTQVDGASAFCSNCGSALGATATKTKKGGGKKGLWIGLIGGAVAALTAVLTLIFFFGGSSALTQEKAIENYIRIFYSNEGSLQEAKEDIYDRLDEYLPENLLEPLSPSERRDFVDSLFDMVLGEGSVDAVTLNASFDGDFTILRSEKSDGVLFVEVKTSFGKTMVARILEVDGNWYPSTLILVYNYWLDGEE